MMLNIFFDTNILENRVGKDLVILHKCDISKNYYDIARFIVDKSLENEVTLNIPRIVLLEIKQHLYEGHVQKGQSIADSIESAKKIFGSILDLDYAFRYSDFSVRETKEEQIEDYVNQIVDDFLKLPINKNLRITPFPKEYESLVERAVKHRLPFYSHKNSNVKITDAGFKDALLLESIIEYINFEDDEVVLFTNDARLLNKEECLDAFLLDKFFVAQSTDECLAILRHRRTTTFETAIITRLEKDAYFLSRLFESINQPLSKDTDGLHIINIRQKEFGNEYEVQSEVVSNEVKYSIKFEYDSIANDYYNVTYSTEND